MSINDEEVLESYYDDRETFIVSFNPNLVDVEMTNGEVKFTLKTFKVKK